jgi:hypothetical protein
VSDQEIKETLGRFDERLKAMETDMPEVKQSLKNIEQAMTDLKVQTASRPTWMVTYAFSALVGAVATLATYIVTRM